MSSPARSATRASRRSTGSPACTTRGFGIAEFRDVGLMMGEVLDGLARGGDDNRVAEEAVAKKVRALTDRFPIYGAA